MSYFFVLGRKVNTTGWEYLGEEHANSPEDAVNMTLDGMDIGEDYELRVIPAPEADDGGPFWYVRDDLDL